MDKEQLRKIMMFQRNSLSDMDKESMTNAITNHIISQSFFFESNNICIYQAFRNEVDCSYIMEHAYSSNKNVYVPITDLKTKTIEFYNVDYNTKWKIGAYGIIEPENKENLCKLTEKALILIPGLVFDQQKHRIGYGGGYYDKYLALHHQHITCGICYDFQLIDYNIPYEEHDIMLNYVVTDLRIFNH